MSYSSIIDGLYNHRILEARTEPLYHGTGFREACEILESNELRANISNETETYGVSLTRNKDAAYYAIRFKIDHEKLIQNYKVKPVYRDGIRGRDLAEERVDRTIKNFRRYILEIQLNNPMDIKVIRSKLVRYFDDVDFIKKERIPGKPTTNPAHYTDLLISLSRKYSIPIDKDLKIISYYLEQFKKRIFDQEYSDHMKNRERNT